MNHGSRLRKEAMPCPEDVISLLIQSMSVSEKESAYLKDWFSKNSTFEKWLKNNEYAFEDFNGNKILVEEFRDVVFNPDGDALVLRHMKEEDVMTYKPAPVELEEVQKKEKIFVFRDYDQKELAQILADPSIFEVLKFRMQKRGKKSKTSKGSEPELDAEKFRVVRDGERWGILTNRNLANKPPGK